MNSKVKPLNYKECQVLLYLAEGYTNERIGEKLGVTKDAAEETLKRMQQKLGCYHPFELISWAYREGVLR